LAVRNGAVCATFGGLKDAISVGSVIIWARSV
jgi:hypothetical protein